VNVEKLKVAIVGCGRISTLKALGYINNPDAEIEEAFLEVDENE